MAKALAGIETGGLANIRLHFGDAAELVAWLPAGALTSVSSVFASRSSAPSRRGRSTIAARARGGLSFVPTSGHTPSALAT